MTFGWIFWPPMPSFRPVQSRRKSIPLTTAIPNTIGPGFCIELAPGKDAAKLTRKLASRRADKPNPLYYAQRTVDVASASLWLIEGIPIDDVVTMLEVRRRFEIPAALCSARAREIALTAQRMIARRKIA